MKILPDINHCCYKWNEETCLFMLFMLVSILSLCRLDPSSLGPTLCVCPCSLLSPFSFIPPKYFSTHTSGTIFYILRICNAYEWHQLLAVINYDHFIPIHFVCPSVQNLADPINPNSFDVYAQFHQYPFTYVFLMWPHFYPLTHIDVCTSVLTQFCWPFFSAIVQQMWMIRDASNGSLPLVVQFVPIPSVHTQSCRPYVCNCSADLEDSM